MSWSAFRTFTDPDAYHTAFRDTRTASVIIGRGDFRAYFVTAQLERLSLQGGNETLPRTVYSAVDPRQWQPSDSSSVPRQLRLLDFPSRPGIAPATAGQTRSPRFRRDPFVRDVASDPGRATVPRVTAPHMLPSAVATASAPATSRISWLNPTPQTITVYASPWSSPSTTQHSLPGGRYPFPGPDFHRLDRASFAWRTATRFT